MQKLNDLYNHERSSHADSRHASSLLEQELVRTQQDNMLLKRDEDNVTSIKSKNKVIVGTINSSLIYSLMCNTHTSILRTIETDSESIRGRKGCSKQG